MAPVRAWDICPPLRRVAQVDWMGLPLEDERAGDEQARVGVRIERGIERTLGHGDVAGLLHKARELLVGDHILIHPEAIYRHRMLWRLFGIVLIRSHEKRPARYPDHARRSLFGARFFIGGTPIVV